MKQANAMQVLIMLLPFAFSVAFSVTDGLLPNGDFEQGPKPWQMNGTVVMAKNAIPNWEVSGFVEYIKSGQKQGDMLLVVPEGAHAVRLGNDASIKQKIAVTRGRFYSITFNVARTCAQDEKLNVSASPMANSGPEDWGILPVQTMYSANGWDSYAWGFQAHGAQIDLSIHNPSFEEDPACGPLIDSVALILLSNPSRTGENLMKNGDFEEGPYVFPNVDWGVLIPPRTEDRHDPLPGWVVESLKAVKYIDSNFFSVPHGRRAIELVAGPESAVAQIVRTVPGKAYALSVSVGDARNSCAGSMAVVVCAGRDRTVVPYQSDGRGGFKRAVLLFKAISTHTRISFFSSYYSMRNGHSGSLCGPVIDNVKLLVVSSH